MKTTEEMHQKYYDKLFEKTGLTPECLDYMDLDHYRYLVDGFNRGNLNESRILTFKRYTQIVVFATNEEQRVNKKWKKRNETKD